MPQAYHLAQANWARMRAPLEDPLLDSFRRRQDPLNALAEASPGFVWRLAGDDGLASSIRAFEDDRILFNQSVWESLDALKAYTFKTTHVELLQDRGRWFETPDRAPSVLWWVTAGVRPSAADGRAKLEHLWANGPGPEAFTFRDLFDPPR
ncbi:MAG: DUF3291 domain-containing protein [Planctomycetota bacterium]|nr:DUF3291 domain-containing protein [Planctomycetota bacterium]